MSSLCFYTPRWPTYSLGTVTDNALNDLRIMEQYPSQIKPQFHLAQTIYQLRPHLSQMRTTKYMPFTRKKTFFLEKNMSQIRGRPPSPPPLESATVERHVERVSKTVFGTTCRLNTTRHDMTGQVMPCCRLLSRGVLVKVCKNVQQRSGYWRVR